jgi:hypothetical protein
MNGKVAGLFRYSAGQEKAVRNKIPVAAVALIAGVLVCGPGQAQSSSMSPQTTADPGRKSGLSKGYTVQAPDLDQHRLATTGGAAPPPPPEAPGGPVDPDNSGGPQYYGNPATGVGAQQR